MLRKGEPRRDLIGRQAAIDALRYAQHRFTVADEAGGFGTVKWSEDVIYFAAAERVLSELPAAQPDNDMIHLQKEQAYLKGWEDGREALRKEIWEDGRDRLGEPTGGNRCD